MGLNSIFVSDTLLVFIRLWIERLIPLLLIRANWSSMIANFVLMFGSWHFRWHNIIATDSSLVTRASATQMVFFMTLWKWWFRAWGFIVWMAFTATVLVLPILLLCDPPRHSLLMILLVFSSAESVISWWATLLASVMDGIRVLFFIMSCRNTILFGLVSSSNNSFFFLRLAVFGKCIAAWSMSRLSLIVTLLISITIALQWWF